MHRLSLVTFLFLSTLPTAGAQPLGWLPASDGLPPGPALALTADSSGVVVSGTLGGPYRLRPGDPTWVLGDGPEAPIQRLARAPSGRIYAALDSAIAVTGDGGASWTRRGAPGFVSYFSGLATPTGGSGEDDVVFAYIQGNPGCDTDRSGLLPHRSSDGGRTWACATDAPVVGHARDLTSTASGALLAVANDGLYRSPDGGARWDTVAVDIDLLYADFGGTAGPYLALYDRDLRLHVSPDDGRTWQATDVQGRPGGLALGADGALYAGVRRVTLIRGGDPKPVVHTGGLYRSTDGGRTWAQTAFGAGLDDPSVQALAPYGGGVLAGSWSGPFWSGDGGETWAPLGDGLRAQLALDVAFGGDGVGFVSTFPRRLHRLDGPAGRPAWEPLALPPFDPDLLDYGSANRFGTPRVGYVRVGTDGTVYAVDGNLLRLRPGTAAWEARPVGFILSDLAVERDGSLLAAAVFQGVHRSRDGGDTWERIGDALPGSGRAEAVLPLPDGTVLAGGFRALYRRAAGAPRWDLVDTGLVEILDLATDGRGAVYAVGRQWVEVSNSATADAVADGDIVGDEVLVSPGGVVETGSPLLASARSDRPAAAVRKVGGASYQATGEGRILRSLDGGRRWEPVDVQVPPLYAVSVDQTGRVYAGGLASEDRGRTWRPSGAGLRGEYVAALAQAPDGRTWAATSGGGVYRSARAAVSVADEPSAAGVGLDVYPNPARHRATVTLTLTQPSSHVDVRVYDALGRHMADAFSGPLSAGAHALPIDLESVPAGVHIVRAIVGGRQATQMLVTVR